MANEKLQDVILDQDTLINYGDGEKPIKEFFKVGNSPVVIVKDMYGEAVEAVNLVEFEEYMQQEAAEAEEGRNFNIANDYDILYKDMQNDKESYHCYKGRYTVGEMDIVKHIKDNFSVQEGSCAMENFPQYIDKQYQVCELAKRQKEEARMAKLQKIEDKIAELEKEGLAEPRIIFLDEKHYCEDILLKEIEKAEIQDKYYDILEGIDCLILYKDQDETRRVHLREQEDMGSCSYNEEHNEEPYVDYRTLINLLYDNHLLNQYANYMPLKKYMLDNLPSLREPRVVFSSYSCINHTLYDNYGKEFLDREIRKDGTKIRYLSQLKPKDLVADHIDFTIYSNTYSGTDHFNGEVKGYEKLEDVDMRKVFVDIKACIADCEHKYGDNEYGDKEVLYQYIDKNIIPKLPKESIMKRVKRKTRLILNLVQDNNRNDGRSRER